MMDAKRHATNVYSRLRHRFPTLELTASHLDSLHTRDREIYTIRPPRESAGPSMGQEFASQFFADSETGRKGAYYSIEAWGRDGRAELVATVPDGRGAVLRDALSALYPGAQAVRRDTPVPDPGAFAAGARLGLAHDSVFPLQHRNTQDPLVEDPHATHLSKVVGGDGELALLQVVFTPVRGRWYKRGFMPAPVGLSGNGIADAFQRGDVHGLANPRTIKPDQRQAAASDIGRQEGRDAFACSMRVIALANTRSRASERVRAITDSLNVVKDAATRQKLVTHPLSGMDLRAGLAAAYGRWPDARPRVREGLYGRRQVLTDEELGDWMLHLPTDIEAPIDWAATAAGERIPSDTV